MKTRRPLAVLAATAITGLGLTALATPANANTTVTVSGDWTWEGSWSGGSVSPIIVNDSALTVTVAAETTFSGIPVTYLNVQNDVLIPPGGPGESNRLDWTGSSLPATSGTFTIPEGTTDQSVSLGTANGQILATLTVTYEDSPSPGPDPDPVPDSGSGGLSATPATVDVTLDQITSEVLRTWASTATLGSWKQLPESNEITGVDENAGKTFLGAATTPDFPVDIAQRQVDNGWGAYETFNEDGDLTSVFIPAGGWMAISNSTRLYAIWGD